MKRPLLWSLLLSAALAGVIAFACAPIFPKAVFTYARHPDFPRTDYLAGKLGIFQPSYARSYLVIAYRHLRGPGLSAAEREQVRAYWKDRVTGDWDKTAVDWEAKWEKARTRVPESSPKPNNAATQGRYAFQQETNSFVLNCAEDAYRTAYESLLSRGSQFGFRSVALRSWRDAQDAVFDNCDGPPAIPQLAPATLPAVIRADRDYQIAAAHFYAGHYAEAESRFRKIAANPASPWRSIAPYLVVRTLLRAAQKDPAGIPVAEAAARAVLADPSLSQLHGMTRVLLHRMILQSSDENYFHELANDLAGGRQAKSFREELWDYTTLYDNHIGDPWKEVWREKQDHAEPAVFQRDDLSDWIYTFQHQGDKARDHAYARWRQTHSLPWLIAALQKARPGTSSAAELIAASAGIDPANPGFIIASFYRLQLMLDSNRKEEVRAILDHLLNSPLPPSSVNLFRGLRMRTAPDLADFLNFAARTPVMLTSNQNEGETPPWRESWESDYVRHAARQTLLDRDSIKILNERTPLRTLAKAALSRAYPPPKEREAVLTAFTRALLLEDSEQGLPLAARLRELGADKPGYLATYRKTEDPEERRFAGIFYILHHPEARPYLASGIGRMGKPEGIDDFRDNWWCPTDISVELDARTNWHDYPAARRDPDSPAETEAFLTDEDRDEAKAELARLAATLSGPDYLIQETMRYARAHRADPRVPEALHYALQAQRYGCVRKQTAALAETAWRYLWRTYPKNAWTRKTNYTFEPANLPRPLDWND